MVRFLLNWVLSGFFLVLLTLGMVAPAQATPFSPIPTIAASSGGGSLFSFSGTRPDNLGVKEGQLAPCPQSPNCVSSQAADTDTEHKIDPLTYGTDPATAIANLKSIIENQARTKIITETDTYLYAEFTSALMGYVDDVEFYLDADAGIIHVRSASRLGQSDLGVNRKRVEAIRLRFTELQSAG